ncbi:glutamate-1-semialdehyde 2,1-aminomutase [Massilia sp. TW-1]|uniref:Glutamate-1-semialdehyde 2,1-aminomutase n=1 Tax=Telluria antibiotica TaxID=2717319 RepID=A0ABX0PAK3_9BURK|nr:glutamate-1-semialdehyde 2,1-aminomutase [Telluria antibiotica]NIA53699.1 glutamate-1-semialdehyde 2,1-aminomutase [Telluria antibiotica]
MSYQDRLLKVIPGGAHTYSRGFDQYPTNAPQILTGGKGAYIFDPEGKRYLDYGMALRAVNIGYAEDVIDNAAIEQIRNGNNLTRPSTIELDAAELLVEQIDSVDMVKFTKNGSSSVSAAVKLARAYTGRELVARCAEHPFFSYDDWFIGSTPLTRGIPQETLQKTKLFRYNDIASLETLIAEHPGQFACVVLEPAATEEPRDGYLHKVQELCKKNGIVFILDEMITGFRWHMKGAQHVYGVTPDLCTFGKAMANGFSVSCIAGRREIMELGSIEMEGRERLFLLSTTHGAEMSGLGAFVATVKFMHEHKVVEHLWDYGRKLTAMMERQAQAHGIADSFKVGGAACSPFYLTLDKSGANSLALRTLFSQEMIKNGVLMPWIALSYRHGDAEIALTEQAIDAAFRVYGRALEEGTENYLQGPVIKPVFRKYN